MTAGPQGRDGLSREITQVELTSSIGLLNGTVRGGQMESQWDDGGVRPNWWFTVHTSAFLLVLLLALLRYAPPDARGPDVAGDEFSAGRVGNLLEKIVRPGVPHPTGSA